MSTDVYSVVGKLSSKSEVIFNGCDWTLSISCQSFLKYIATAVLIRVTNCFDISVPLIDIHSIQPQEEIQVPHLSLIFIPTPNLVHPFLLDVTGIIKVS